MPQPKLISSQLAPLPYVAGRTTFATTPTPRSIRTPVPTTSLPNTVHRLMRCSSSPVMRRPRATPVHGAARTTAGAVTLFTQVGAGQRGLYDHVAQPRPASGPFAPGDAELHGALPLRVGGV